MSTKEKNKAPVRCLTAKELDKLVEYAFKHRMPKTVIDGKEYYLYPDSKVHIKC
jgi:hypothetical protein